MGATFPFPVLHEDSFDYGNPNSYSAQLTRINTSEKSCISAKHELMDGNLVAHLIKEKKATFFMSIVVKGTIFRRTEQLKISENSNPTLIRDQSIDIPKLYTNPEIFAYSGVVTIDGFNDMTSEEYGLSDFYNGVEIKIPKFSKIAYRNMSRFFSLSALFQIESVDSIIENKFKTYIMPGIFKIHIVMSKDMYNKVVDGNPNGSARRHVTCTALAMALSELSAAKKRTEFKYGEEYDAELLQQAAGFKSYLISEGLSTWDDADFNPTFVASSLKPVVLGELSE